MTWLFERLRRFRRFWLADPSGRIGLLLVLLTVLWFAARSAPAFI